MMKIKKLIAELTKILNESGNLTVYLSTDMGDKYFKLMDCDYFDADTIFVGLTADSGKE